MMKEHKKLLVLTENDLYDLEEYRETAAEKAGCSIVYPKNNELQIDIDTHDDYARFEAAIENMPGGLVFSVVEKSSRSGIPHKHITVTLSKNFSDLEKIALQFMLGSDYIRESLSVSRVLHGIEKPTCFFEKE